MKRGALNLNSADLRLDIQIRILFSGSVSQPASRSGGCGRGVVGDYFKCPGFSL